MSPNDLDISKSLAGLGRLVSCSLKYDIKRIIIPIWHIKNNFNGSILQENVEYCGDHAKNFLISRHFAQGPWDVDIDTRAERPKLHIHVPILIQTS